MLCDYFYSYPFITEGHNDSLYIVYINSTTSTPPPIEEGERSALEGSSSNSNNNNNDYIEEESFEIEEEIEDIDKKIELSNNAKILDERLPDSEKEKNSYLNDLRKDPNVKEFFEGKTLNIEDLPELYKALKESREEKIKELSEVTRNFKEEKSSTSSFKNSLDSSSRESNNKEDFNNPSEFKLDQSLLDSIIDTIWDIFF